MTMGLYLNNYIRQLSCIYMELLKFLIAACLPGRFGKYCLQECSCSGSDCDPRTGKCLCASGKMGPKCEKGDDYKMYSLSWEEISC